MEIDIFRKFSFLFIFLVPLFCQRSENLYSEHSRKFVIIFDLRFAFEDVTYIPGYSHLGIGMEEQHVFMISFHFAGEEDNLFVFH